jgi:MFS family permease
MIPSQTNDPKSFLRISTLIAAIFFCRIFGLMSLLTLLPLIKQTYINATPALIGIALGIYGLAQALLQIPLGLLSDRYGRKQILYLGLSFLFTGSLIGCFATNIVTLIVARACQGFGAIGSTCLATLADFVTIDERPTAMMIVGISIGASIGLSLVVGSYIAAHYSIQLLFLVMTVFALLAMFLVSYIPNKKHTEEKKNVSITSYIALFKNNSLMFINASIALTHVIYTSFFVVFPIMLSQQFHHKLTNLWVIYGYLLLLSCLIAFSAIRFLKKSTQRYNIITTLCLLMGITLLTTSIDSSHSIFLFYFEGLLILTLFSLLEAYLPDCIARIAPTTHRGLSMGLFSSCQYLGIFSGATITGILLEFATPRHIFTLFGALMIVYAATSAYCNNSMTEATA